MSEFAINPDVPVRRRLGPVDLLFERGDIRYISIGGREVLRRVYVAVRDGSWGTIPGVISDLQHEDRPDGFRITYRCEHRAGEIHWGWEAEILGRWCVRGGVLDAELSFSMDGRALGVFHTNRTGFCVLHPITECAGQPCMIEHTSGVEERAVFPGLVQPHQLFTDLAGMIHEPVPGMRAEVRFTGETFETEDQRNWTDGSFKTYSRPLARPFPYPLEKGQTVRQTVTLKITGQIPVGDVEQLAQPQLWCRLSSLHRLLPPLGVDITANSMPTQQQLDRLRSLNLSHLRLDLRLANSNLDEHLTRAIDQSNILNVPLELAVHLHDDPEPRLHRLNQELQRLRPRVIRCLIYRDRQPMIRPQDVELARRCLSSALVSIPIGGGTIGSFAELNRNRPEGGSMDVLAYPVNPQVHAGDDLSLMENLQGQGDTVRTARAFAAGAAVAIGPITLHRIADPFAAGNSGAAPEVGPDVRQRSGFGAAWTAGSIKNLAEAGADSLTYYQTIGPFGVMEGGEVFPVYHVFKAIGEMRGGRVVECRASNPLAFDALAMRLGRRLRVLVACLGNQPVDLIVQGLPDSPRRLRLAPYEVATLDYNLEEST